MAIVAALCASAWAAPGKTQQPEVAQAEDQRPTTGTEQEKKTPDAAASKEGQQGQGGQTSGAPASTDGTTKDRLFYALPNFLTLENAGQVPPMTAGQKFKVEVRSSFDPIQIAWYGFLSGISQAENSEPGYGQGASGYGKRFGAAAADGTIENFMVAAALPSLFHQDPRFFQSGHGGFMHRAFYAWSRIVVTRTDSGNSQVNVSEILGSALASSISTYSYHPRSDRTISNTAKVWGTQIGYDSLTLVVKEFWPDVRRWVHKSRNKQAN